MSRPSRRHAVLGMLLVASAAFLLYSLRSGRPGGGPAGGAAAGAAVDSDAAAAKVGPAGILPEDVEFDRYRRLAATDVFSKVRSAPAQQPQKSKRLPPTPPPIQPAERAAPTIRQADFSGWTYTGYIAIDGERRGILQNESGNICKDIPVGGEFLGATVEEVTRDSMVLKSGRSAIELRVPDVFPITPLEKGPSGGPPPRPRPR